MKTPKDIKERPIPSQDKSAYSGYAYDKFLLVKAVLFSILGLCSILVLSQEVHKPYQKHLGKTCIINGDTLEVVDYSVFWNEATMSNGVKVGIEYLDQ